MLCTLLCTTIANTQDISTRLFTAKDGLPSTYVYGCYQDKFGYLWVGTHEGLSRFDGHSFANYGLREGLPDTRVCGAFMDSRDRLWAITVKGVAQLKANRFIHYPLSDSEAINWVMNVVETRAGQILMLSHSGIYQFCEDKWCKLKTYPGYDNHPCVALMEATDGTYISYGDLVVLKTPEGNYRVIASHPKPAYYYGAFSKIGKCICLWTADGIVQIVNNRLEKLNGALRRFKDGYNFLCDREGRIWIGESRHGVLLASSLDAAAVRTVYQGPSEFLPQGITEDREGNVWVGTGTGLLRFAHKGFHLFDAGKIFGSKVIRNLVQPPSGPPFINDGSRRLTFIHNDSFFRTALAVEGSGGLPNNELIIDDYAFDNRNAYWYAARGFALIRQKQQKLSEQSRQLGCLNGDVLAVLFDNYRNRITVALVGQAFPVVFNGDGFSVFKPSNNIGIEGYITHLHQCKNGTVLFSTAGGCIYGIDTANVCRLLLREFSGKAVLSAFLNDPSGDVWLLYNGRGLRRYIWQKNALVLAEELTTANGLDNDAATSAVFDNKANLWVCTNSGVFVFANKGSSQPHKEYGVSASFSAQDLNVGDGVDTRLRKCNNGDLWLFSARHLVRFSPGQLHHNTPIRSVQLEKVELNLRPTDWTSRGDSVTGLFGLPVQPSFTHEDNAFGFYFKGVNASGTDGIRYSFRLKGYSEEWSAPSANDFVSFVGLAPGHYVFNVKARLNNAAWTLPASFAFTIKKAYWQTGWFRALLLLILFAGLYWLFRFRLQQKLKVLEMRNRLSRDLHDEIGSSVSGINLLSQMAVDKLQQNQRADAEDYMLKVKNYTADVIEKLSDMVWIFNPQNDSFEKLVSRLKTFAVSVALPKNIQLQFDAAKEGDGKNLSVRQRKAIYLISKEAINNAVKYSDCRRLVYSFQTHRSSFLLRIEDDGKGFVYDEESSGNGLRNMQARAREAGAKFSLQSAPGKGTLLTLKL